MEELSNVADDEQPELLYCAVLILGGLTYCKACGREANPDAPLYSDEEYDAQAGKMHSEGWTSTDGVTVLCPECSKVSR